MKLIARAFFKGSSRTVLSPVMWIIRHPSKSSSLISFDGQKSHFDRYRIGFSFPVGRFGNESLDSNEDDGSLLAIHSSKSPVFPRMESLCRKALSIHAEELGALSVGALSLLSHLLSLHFLFAESAREWEDDVRIFDRINSSFYVEFSL